MSIYSDFLTYGRDHASLTTNNIPKVNNRLEERAFLSFYFPDPKIDPPEPIYCPFFENPEISESQSANLINYDVIGRAGSLWGYTGAKSRKFTVKFSMTLPLMMHLSAEAFKTMGQWKENRQRTTKELQELFFENSPSFDRPKKGRSWASYAQVFVDSLDNGDPTGFEHMLNAHTGPSEARARDGAFFGLTDIGAHSPNEEQAVAVNPNANTIKDRQLSKTVDLMTYWVNLIRSSVINNSKIPVLGPPIIRLTFGSLYRNVATVASDYKITYDPVAGFDMASLLPHRVIINLTLNEVRLNTAEGFSPHQAVRSDSLVGWEHTYTDGFISADPDSTATGTPTVYRRSTPIL